MTLAGCKISFFATEAPRQKLEEKFLPVPSKKGVRQTSLSPVGESGVIARRAVKVRGAAGRRPAASGILPLSVAKRKAVKVFSPQTHTDKSGRKSILPGPKQRLGQAKHCRLAR